MASLNVARGDAPKRVVFITFYDMICYGTRLLCSVARECGLDVHLILVKSEKSHVPIWKEHDQYETYQYFFNGLKRGSLYAVDPITDTEQKLLRNQVRDLQPDLICLSTRSFAYEICKGIFPQLKADHPNAPIVAGGWGPALEPEKFLEFSDFAFFGEGERAFGDICERIAGGTDPWTALAEGQNITRTNADGELIRNSAADPLKPEEMDAVPFPDFDRQNKYLVAENTVRPGRDFYNEKIYDIFAGRGCPMNCSYCMSSKYKSLYKEEYDLHCPKWRLRSVDRVMEELRLAKANGATIIRFKDEVFPPSPSWVQELLPRYQEEIGLPFFAYLRPEFHPPELIEKIVEAGCYSTVIGIQSGSEEIRKKVYFRNLPEEQILEFARLVNKHNLVTQYHFIYRNPLEQEHHLAETLQLINKLPYGPVMIFKLQRFPKSPISQMIEAEQPMALPTHVHLWYAELYTMACHSPLMRRLANWIHRRKIARRTPMLLSLLFAPGLVREFARNLISRTRYKTVARLLPNGQRQKPEKTQASSDASDKAVPAPAQAGQEPGVTLRKAG